MVCSSDTSELLISKAVGVSMNLWFVAPTPRPADQQGCRCLYELMVCSSDTSELLISKAVGVSMNLWFVAPTPRNC